MGEGEVRELQLHIREPAPTSPKDAAFTRPQPSSNRFNWKWWLLLFIYTVFILAGQTAGTLLGRFYFKQGGKSLWMASILPSSGFPLLIPLLLLLLPRTTSRPSRPPCSFKLATTYTVIGLLVTGDNLMYSYGLLYLPVSTFSLLCATQLAFNAVFSYFLNSQKFTPFIFNSVILLTLAAALLGIHSDGGATSTNKYALGVILTISASALFSLILSLTQLAFDKVVKAETFAAVVEMIMWTGFVAAAGSVVGLFAGGEWRGVHEEYLKFEKGRISYVMTLTWIAVCWLVYSVGTVGLISMVSSLFSNVIGTFGLPLVPIFAVVFFHERMDGVKVVALLIAMLGFANYVYQHFLDDSKEKTAIRRDELLDCVHPGQEQLDVGGVGDDKAI